MSDYEKSKDKRKWIPFLGYKYASDSERLGGGWDSWRFYQFMWEFPFVVFLVWLMLKIFL